jgi:hypothetical protein
MPASLGADHIRWVPLRGKSRNPLQGQPGWWPVQHAGPGAFRARAFFEGPRHGRSRLDRPGREKQASRRMSGSEWKSLLHSGTMVFTMICVPFFVVADAASECPQHLELTASGRVRLRGKPRNPASRATRAVASAARRSGCIQGKGFFWRPRHGRWRPDKLRRGKQEAHVWE